MLRDNIIGSYIGPYIFPVQYYFIQRNIYILVLLIESQNKIKRKKYYTVGTVPNKNIVERGKINTPNTHVHCWAQALQ